MAFLGPIAVTAGELLVDELLGDTVAAGVEEFTQGLVSAEEGGSVQAPLRTTKKVLGYVKKGKQIYDLVEGGIGELNTIMTKRPREEEGHSDELTIANGGGDLNISGLHLPASNTISVKFWRYTYLDMELTHYLNGSPISVSAIHQYGTFCNPTTETAGWNTSMPDLTYTQRRMRIDNWTTTVLPWSITGTTNDDVVRANSTPQMWIRYGFLNTAVAKQNSTIGEDNADKEDDMLRLANTVDMTVSSSKVPLSLTPVVLHNLPSYSTSQTVTMRNSIKGKWFDINDLQNIGVLPIRFRLYVNGGSVGMDHSAIFPDPAPKVVMPTMEVVNCTYNFTA